MKIVKWFFITPVILIVLGIIGTELNKAYWDNQVRAMCEKDGGVTIFERIAISKKDYPNMRFRENGELMIKPEGTAKLTDPFYYKFHDEYMHKGFLNIVKHDTSIILREGEKVLSTRISYGRGGGDFPTGFHPSSYSCENNENNIKLLDSAITVIKGD